MYTVVTVKIYINSIKKNIKNLKTRTISVNGSSRTPEK